MNIHIFCDLNAVTIFAITCGHEVHVRFHITQQMRRKQNIKKKGTRFAHRLIDTVASAINH